MSLNAYLYFDGRCAEALAFYARVLGGEIEFSQTYGDSPGAEHAGPGWQDKVMHARLRVGDDVVMASDSPPQWQEKPQGFAVSLVLRDLDETRRAFDALAEGGTVKMPFEPTFWAKGFGMLTDRFGVPWMINCQDDQA
jgi:PhnB protein